ncbi:MAG TPA: thiamine-phosphate kinase [Gemmatimonadota bacterium]|nr:thiamine-phosphate kinase [Gemmatimonadota bacterium]
MTDRGAPGEFERIGRLARLLGGESERAIGDDAAILAGDRGPWAWTVDTLVEGVHFRFDWLDPPDVGHRALAAAASDLAAMTAEPAGVLVAAAVAAGAADVLEAVYAGFRDLADRAGCPVLGGDLVRSPGPLVLTITALGRCPAEPLRRSGARPGDEVWVTGELGGPAAALASLSGGGDPPTRGHPAYRRLARPEPRVREALWLRGRVAPSAGIDISDGLSGDAGHVARASGVALRLNAAAIPVHPGARDLAARLGRDALAWALHGGEEFELLLCASAGAIQPHVPAFEELFGIPLTRIGRVDEGDGVWLRDASGAEERLDPLSYDHFRDD